MPNSRKSSISEDSVTPAKKQFKRVSTIIGGKGEGLLHTILAKKEDISEEDCERISRLFNRSIHSITKKRSDGNTPIHIAAEFVHGDIINEALSKICEVQIIEPIDTTYIFERNEQGKNLLHLAVENKHLISTNDRHLKSVQVLIEYLDHFGYLVKFITEQDGQGRTPLHLAVLSTKDLKDPPIDYGAIVRKLLDVPNVDTTITGIKDKYSKSVYDCVIECRDTKVIDLFLQYYARKERRTQIQFTKNKREADSREKLSRRCNRAAVGSALIADVSNILREYASEHITSYASIIKFLAVAPHFPILLAIALVCHNSASFCKKKCNQLNEDIEECKTRISELHNRLKDIEHDEAIARLERDFQDNQTKLSEIGSRCESRVGNHVLGAIHHKTDSKSSVVQPLPYSKNSERPSSTSPVPNLNVITRPRAASCGARFVKVEEEKNKKPSTILRDKAIAKLKKDFQESKKTLSDIESKCEESFSSEDNSRHETSSCAAQIMRASTGKENNEEELSTTLQSPRSLRMKGIAYSRLQ